MMNAPSRLPVLPFTTAEIAFILFFLMLNMLFLVSSATDRPNPEPCPTRQEADELVQHLGECRDKISKSLPWKVALEGSGLSEEEGWELMQAILIAARKVGIKPEDIPQSIDDGKGIPSCWYNLENKEEYLFQIILYDHGVRFDPVWPGRRAVDAAKIPGVSEIQTGIVVSPESQSHALNRIFAYSDRKNPVLQDEPPCRYYAWFVNEATTLPTYKEQLDYLEGFFYKNYPISKKGHPSMRR